MLVLLWVPIVNGWSWYPLQPEIMQMIAVIYIPMAVLMVVGSYDLAGSKHFIDNFIWGSVAHALLMLGQAVWDWEVEYHHVMPYGDVPALLVFAGLTYYFKSRASASVGYAAVSSGPGAGVEPQVVGASSGMAAAARSSQPELSADEARLAWSMKVVGVLFSPLSMVPLIYGFKYGWEWKPPQHEQVPMIIAIYGVLAYYLTIGSNDLKGSRHLLNYAIWGACFAHAVLMLGQAVVDWGEEWHHVMPYGDVMVLMLLGGILLYLKTKAYKSA